MKTNPTAGSIGDWISVEEEMPDDETTVLVWVNGDATLACHDSEILERRKDTGWIMADTSRVLLNVTHWCKQINPPTPSTK